MNGTKTQKLNIKWLPYTTNFQFTIRNNALSYVRIPKFVIFKLFNCLFARLVHIFYIYIKKKKKHYHSTREY
jgi:hypothetical protein